MNTVLGSLVSNIDIMDTNQEQSDLLRRIISILSRTRTALLYDAKDTMECSWSVSGNMGLVGTTEGNSVFFRVCAHLMCGCHCIICSCLVRLQQVCQRLML